MDDNKKQPGVGRIARIVAGGVLGAIVGLVGGFASCCGCLTSQISGVAGGGDAAASGAELIVLGAIAGAILGAIVGCWLAARPDDGP